MEAPISDLAKMVFRTNHETESRVMNVLWDNSLQILKLEWPIEKMEKYYLRNLERLINNGKTKEKDLQRFFSDYLVLRDILEKENSNYVAIPTTEFNEPHLRLHMEKYDEKFRVLKNLATEKGYTVNVFI